MSTVSNKITWTCDVCGQPVDDGTGYLHASYLDIQAAKDARKQYDQEHAPDGGWQVVDLLNLPKRAPWQVHHRACDPRPDGGDYIIEVERIRTHLEVLERTAHLLEKTWLPLTDWNSIIQRVVKEAHVSL